MVNLMTSGQSIPSFLLGIYEVIKIVKLLVRKHSLFPAVPRRAPEAPWRGAAAGPLARPRRGQQLQAHRLPRPKGSTSSPGSESTATLRGCPTGL